MVTQTETPIQRAEEARDLRGQIQGLEAEDRREIIFKETSPRRRKTTIFAMSNGEPLLMPEYQALKAISKIDPETGTFMFTAYKDKAPEYKLGTVLCFLHKDSSDHPVLQKIGLGQLHCRKKTLANLYSKRQHARNRHPKEWEAYQDHLETEKERRAEDRQEAQLDATLALAGQAAKVTVPKAKGEERATMTLSVCDSCGAPIAGKLADHHCEGS